MDDVSAPILAALLLASGCAGDSTSLTVFSEGELPSDEFIRLTDGGPLPYDIDGNWWCTVTLRARVEARWSEQQASGLSATAVFREQGEIILERTDRTTFERAGIGEWLSTQLFYRVGENSLSAECFPGSDWTFHFELADEEGPLVDLQLAVEPCLRRDCVLEEGPE